MAQNTAAYLGARKDKPAAQHMPVIPMKLLVLIHFVNIIFSRVILDSGDTAGYINVGGRSINTKSDFPKDEVCVGVSTALVGSVTGGVGP